MSNKFSVITVSFNSGKYLGEYFKSLLPEVEGSGEMILFDNGSSDDSRKIAFKEPRVKLVVSGTNLGFSKANNKASKYADGEYLLFLNPDTRVEKGSIEKLITFAEKADKFALVAPRLVEDGDNNQPSVRNFPTIWGAIKEYYFGMRNAYEPYCPEGMNGVAVESVVGAVVLIKRQLFERIGGFDERFFMYFEDIELCRKVKNMGLEVYFLGESVFYHKVGGSISAKKTKYFRDAYYSYHGLVNGAILDVVLFLRPWNLGRIFQKWVLRRGK